MEADLVFVCPPGQEDHWELRLRGRRIKFTKGFLTGLADALGYMKRHGVKTVHVSSECDQEVHYGLAGTYSIDRLAQKVYWQQGAPSWFKQRLRRKGIRI